MLDDPNTTDELAPELELDIVDARDRVAYLEMFDRVRRDGETVRLAEQHEKSTTD